MIVYVVITVFQGVFDAIEVFPVEFLADNYVAKLKTDFTQDDLEIVKKPLEMSEEFFALGSKLLSP